MDKLLTIKQVAELLNVSERTIMRLKEKSELRYHRIGRLIRFKESDIEAYLKNAKVKPLEYTIR